MVTPVVWASGVELLTGLQQMELNELDVTSGHDHDGSNSKVITLDESNLTRMTAKSISDWSESRVIDGDYVTTLNHYFTKASRVVAMASAQIKYSGNAYLWLQVDGAAFSPEAKVYTGFNVTTNAFVVGYVDIATTGTHTIQLRTTEGATVYGYNLTWWVIGTY